MMGSTRSMGCKMLDIREGDYLVDSNAREYPIKVVQAWEWRYGRGIRRLLTKTVSTKRQPPLVNGKRGGRSTKLTGLKATPIDPGTTHTAEILRSRFPSTFSPPEGTYLQTFVDGGDVYYHLILEQEHGT